MSDKDLEFASGLNHSDFVRLGANRLHDLPDASNWQVLRDCDISVDEFAGTGLSIQLPKNRSSPYLSFVIRSQIGKLFRVSKLQGMFLCVGNRDSNFMDKVIFGHKDPSARIHLSACT